jgi:prepilin-type N-terminal cleavage/methylation domain-containing protein/prepilin-type processing-associated H-X9-DG protein
MHKRKGFICRTCGGFTLIELLVVIAIIAILMSILMPSLNRAREQGKRANCLFDMKQLAFAWTLYADENDDRIVNGEALWDPTGAPAAPVPTSGRHLNERWWVGNDCAQNYMTQAEQRPPDIQIAATRAGALYPYCKSEKLYRCPTGIRGEMRTYSIVDSMNGLYRDGTHNGDAGVVVGRTVLWVKKKIEITVPGPTFRAVFIDEGRVTPDSYAVHYLNNRWWDPPHVRHGDGTDLSFADGHSEYWKHKGKKTIATGKMANPEHQMQPVTADEFEDLQRMQKAVWGRLGY